MGRFSDYHEYDGLGLAELVRRRRVSAPELVEEAIARIEAHNPRINALIEVVRRLNAAWLLEAAGAVKKLAAQTFEFMPYTPLFNVTGQPAMSIPMHWNDAGLPIGVQVVGGFGDESTLFRLAGQLERAQPWGDRVPPE